MHRYKVFFALLCLWVVAACRPIVVNDRPNQPHDNGKHKGWYKNGRHGLPPGQARKQGTLPPGQAKKRGW